MRNLLILACALVGFQLPASAHEPAPASTIVWTNPDCIKGTCFCLFHNRNSNVAAPLAVISGGQSTVVVSTIPKATIVFQEVQPLKPIAPTIVFQDVQPIKAKADEGCTCATCSGNTQYLIEHTHKRGLFGPKAVTKIYSFEK